MRKQGGYSCSHGGLIVGITSFLFISLYVIHELSYDRFHSNYENIYRLKVVGRMAGSELNQAVTAAPMAQAMLNDYPEIIKATRLRNMGDWLIGYGENRFNESGVIFADSTFFDVLDSTLKGICNSPYKAKINGHVRGICTEILRQRRTDRPESDDGIGHSTLHCHGGC